MSRKKRAKALLPAIKELITRRAIWEFQRNREELADSIIDEVKRKYPKEVPPAWETTIKLISAARNHERDPRDNPWYIHTLNDYPLPAEAIGKIIEVQRLQPEHYALPVLEEGVTRQRLMDGRKGKVILEVVDGGQQYVGVRLGKQDVPEPGERLISDSRGRKYRAIGISIKFPLSIRQALWISRLYAVSSLDNPRALAWASLAYSMLEIISDIAKNDFDSSELDAILRQDKPDEALKNYFYKYTQDELQGLFRYMAGFPLKNKRRQNERIDN